MFTWIPIYCELARKLQEYRNRQSELIAFLNRLRDEGLPVFSLRDRDGRGRAIPLAVIDPFTVLAAFNRRLKPENRISILRRMKAFFHLKESLPRDLDGIPLVNNQNAWFFPFRADRKDGDIDALWNIAHAAAQPGQPDEPLFSRCLDIHRMGLPKLTVGLFWMQPDRFLPCDGRTRLYLQDNGLVLPEKTPRGYEELTDQVRMSLDDSFPRISLQAASYTPPEPVCALRRRRPPGRTDDSYTRETALKELFIDENRFDDILNGLQQKKSIILQGPPGVGKTFLARRIAQVFTGKKETAQVEMIQFHPSYAYEDFIQGYRPAGDGSFRLKNGVFYQFTELARQNPGSRYVFVIDEINRANLGKVFGELMMLLESDKRGRDFSVPLTCAEGPGDRFYLPENLHLIGTMNTADRSATGMDYALRRRFRFFLLEPMFHSPKFRNRLIEAGIPQKMVSQIADRITHLNRKIAAEQFSLGPGFQIGHSFFCPDRPVTDAAAWYRNIIDHEIRPLLHEYWFDDPGKADRLADQLLRFP